MSENALQAKPAEECLLKPTYAFCQISINWEILKQRMSFNKQVKLKRNKNLVKIINLTRYQQSEQPKNISS